MSFLRAIARTLAPVAEFAGRVLVEVLDRVRPMVVDRASKLIERGLRLIDRLIERIDRWLDGPSSAPA